MASLHALQHQLVKHLCHQLPALQGHVYVAPTSSAEGTVDVTEPSRSRQAVSSLWLQGPNWRFNPWASCLPDPIVRQDNRFIRYHAPLAWDLLYNLLILSRCPQTLNTIAAQLCTCLAHADSITVPPQTQHTSKQEQSETPSPYQNGVPHIPPGSYGLVWDQAALSRHIVNTSGWHTLAGRLLIEGVPLHNNSIAQHGSIASKPVQLAGPSIRQ